jgi:glycosyltransferase involved in cell wall biosynthesis
MRVAQIMAGAPAGGAELFFERVSIALAGAGEEVLPVIRRDAARADRLRATGLRPVELGFGGALDLATRWRLRATISRFQPRVAMAWMGRAAAAVPQGDWVLVGRLGGTYDLRRFRRCDHLVANTRGLVRWITDQGWPVGRVQYLPNFVLDLRQAEPVPRAALGVPENARMVLALGRLHPNKGFDILIRAMALLPGVHLVVAGGGPKREALATLVERQGLSARVHLLGWREDTGGLLKGADVLVCASRVEPLGNVIIEGWAARRPVVAAAAAGPCELIRDGEDGMLVPIDDPPAIAEAIRRVLEDQGRASKLAVAGCVRYETEFSEQPVLARWREFLAHVEKP